MKTSESTHPRRICIVTGTRAEWGLLSPIASALQAHRGVELQIVATNMHLEAAYGNTIDEILADGFNVNVRVPMHAADDSTEQTAIATAKCLDGMARAFARLQPDMVVILGDRTEMLAVATAALIMRIPIVHIAGGEVSEGAIDDSIRHAITKLSALHLTATEPYRQRVIQMGEHPDRVINTGAIGVYNNFHEPVMSRMELESSLGFSLEAPTLLVTYHPATLDQGCVADRCQALLEALDRFPDMHILFTYPNNDANGRIIIDMIERYASERTDRVKVVPSLGRRRYLSALRYVAAVVGNSSSGIVEVPSAGIPTVDIGIRQQGRIASPSVIHCGDSPDQIADAIAKALSEPFRESARSAVNPYFKPDTLSIMIKAITETPLKTLQTKTFHNLPQ